MGGQLEESNNLFEHLSKLLKKGIDPADHEIGIWENYGEERCVLVIDTVGFTRISSEQGIVYFLSKLVLIREAIIPVIEGNGGEGVRPYADNVYAMFNSPRDALKSAIEANQELKKRKLMLTPKEPCQISCGIGFGRLLYTSKYDGYFGNEMNLAFKLGEDIAAGGEILISQNSFNGLPKKSQKLFEKRSTSISGTVIPYFRLFCQ